MSEQRPPEKTPKKPTTGRLAYNVVTDTLGGPNVRLKDNLLQGLAILVCLLLGAVIGFLVITDGLAGFLLGGFVRAIGGIVRQRYLPDDLPGN
jgi:hypothetical protein